MLASGGGLILSKEALRVLIEDVVPHNDYCKDGDGGGVDDWILGNVHIGTIFNFKKQVHFRCLFGQLRDFC